jgi:adenylate kinase family enzyme
MGLVILGGTGAGKGTKTAKISNNIGILSISTGKILRTGIAEELDFFLNN